jgi:hypothetical protein
MALPGTVSADDLKSPLEEPKDCSSGSPFQLGELGTFLGALPTSVGATGKCFNLRMLVASFGKFLTSARIDIAEWICIFRTALKQLRRQSRDPRTIPYCCDRCSNHIDIALGESGSY